MVRVEAGRETEVFWKDVFMLTMVKRGHPREAKGGCHRLTVVNMKISFQNTAGASGVSARTSGHFRGTGIARASRTGEGPARPRHGPLGRLRDLTAARREGTPCGRPHLGAGRMVAEVVVSTGESQAGRRSPAARMQTAGTAILDVARDLPMPADA